MRNFAWSCFTVTGSIDAYLLYKEFEAIQGRGESPDQEGEEEEIG